MKKLFLFCAVFCVFSMALFCAPVVNVSPSAIQNDSLDAIQIDVSSFTGPDIIIRLYVDIDGDGIIDPEDYISYTTVLEDNVSEWSPNIFDDQNPSLGQMRVNPKFFTFEHIPYTAGNYVWQIEDTFDSSTGTDTFSVTQNVLLPQTVSGTVYDEFMMPVPGAIVGPIPFSDCGRSGPFVISDTNGDFTIYITGEDECRYRILGAVKPGYSLDTANAPLVFLDGASNLVQDLTLYGGTNRVSGYAKFSDGPDVSMGIPGLWVLASRESDRMLSFSPTDENGYYEMFLPDGTWFVGIKEEIALSYEGAVLDNTQWQGAFVSGGPVAVPDLNYPAADYFITGALRNEAGTAFYSGMKVDAGSGEMSTATITDNPAGSFAIGVKSGDWHAGLWDDVPEGSIIRELFLPGVSADMPGQDLILYDQEQTITGIVTNRWGNTVSGICVKASAGIGGYYYVSKGYTDCGGVFSLSVINGDWQVEVITDGISRLGYDEIAKSKQVTVNNISVSGLHFVLLDNVWQPKIYFSDPAENYEGEMINIYGRNLGSAPVAYFNGTPATTEFYNIEQGILTVTVPIGATTGPLSVLNTDFGVTTNSIYFTVLPGGPVTPTCSINGNLTDNLSSPLTGVYVYLYNADTEKFIKATTSDALGNYSISTVPGNYGIWFQPPAPFAAYWFGVFSCPYALNHQFSAGNEIYGSVVNENMDSILFAMIEVCDIMDHCVNIVADENGEYSAFVPNGDYEILFEGPWGTRYVAQQVTLNNLTGDHDNGQTVMETGWIISGTAFFRNNAGKKPLGGVDIEAYNSSDLWHGLGITRGDGNFDIPVREGDQLRLHVKADDEGYLNLDVKSLTVESDVVLDYRLMAYSPDSIISSFPMIYEMMDSSLQVGQKIAVDCLNVDGTAVDIQFSNGIGGWINGTGTRWDPLRGSVLTTVPSGAQTGGLRVRVDSVNSDPFPVVIEPGIFSPGAETISGVIDDGTNPVSGALVILLVQDGCDNENIWDYSVTDSGGNYSLYHNTGDYLMIILPPASSGFAAEGSVLPGLPAGATLLDKTLTAGFRVSSHFVDSGTGPVGNTGADIPSMHTWAEGNDFEDWMLSDSVGNVEVFLSPGEYQLCNEGSFKSRYFSGGCITQTISGDTDFGDIPVDSGYFIEGRIVDPSGYGLAGIWVSAHEAMSSGDGYYTMTNDASGFFRLAVQPGTYNLNFEFETPNETHYIPGLQNVIVDRDTLIYPAIEAQEGGLITGTVYDSAMSPLGEIWISVQDPDTYQFVNGNESCMDGTYSIVVPDGDYTVQYSSWDEPCYASEYYDNTQYNCESTAVSVATPLETSGIDFTLDPGGIISGQVTDSLMTPLAGIMVCADEGPGSPCSLSCGWTEGDGSYTIYGVPADTPLRISATDFSSSYVWECYNGYMNCTDYDPVTVNACGETSGINFTLSVASDAPGAVPDGNDVPGSLVGASKSGSSDINTWWQNTCNVSDHVIYIGVLGNFSVYTHAVCNAGVDGWETFTPPAGNIFWVVAGTNGIDTEGSYGKNSNGEERLAAGAGICGFNQNLTGTCVP